MSELDYGDEYSEGFSDDENLDMNMGVDPQKVITQDNPFSKLGIRGFGSIPKSDSVGIQDLWLVQAALQELLTYMYLLYDTQYQQTQGSVFRTAKAILVQLGLDRDSWLEASLTIQQMVEVFKLYGILTLDLHIAYQQVKQILEQENGKSEELWEKMTRGGRVRTYSQGASCLDQLIQEGYLDLGTPEKQTETPNPPKQNQLQANPGSQGDAGNSSGTKSELGETPQPQ